jgi:hypothetical protein
MLYSQNYYGKNDFGRIEIINDSTCTVAFTKFNKVNIDTCFFYKHLDTIWISSDIKKRYTFIPHNNNPIVVTTAYAVPIRIYTYADNGEYKMVKEFAALVDLEKEQFIINEQSIYMGDLIVIKDLLGYQRLICEENSRYFIIKNNAMYSNKVVFDEFPLLINGNYLTPIDKEKNKQCWVDNGFYIPIMSRDIKDRNFNVIKSEWMGLMDLPNEFEALKYSPAY